MGTVRARCMIKKYENGWMVDFYPEGKFGPRVRKRGFRTRIDALNYERNYFNQPTAPKRRLLDLVRLWYDLHGNGLKDHQDRFSKTMAIAQRLGNPRVKDFKTSDWAEYRTRRLEAVKPATVNHEQRYLSAVFSEMRRLGYCDHNPLADVRQIQVDETELTFLSLAQCQQLLQECQRSRNTHAYPVAVICLATGARWGEAEALTHSRWLPGKVVFSGTKNGKTRTVPIDPDLQAQLTRMAFPGTGRMWDSCRAAFRKAYERCGFNTPKQLTHILRHTFASHYMMAGGDLLSLQRILGHSNIQMTMRYAHLSPDYLESAVRLSPLAQMGESSQKVVKEGGEGQGEARNPLNTGSKGRIRTADPGIMSAVL